MMSLNLTDLSLLIELVEEELMDLRAVINDENTERDVIDEMEALVVQITKTANHLREQYEELWTEDCDYPNYSTIKDAIDQQDEL